MTIAAANKRFPERCHRLLVLREEDKVMNEKVNVELNYQHVLDMTPTFSILMLFFFIPVTVFSKLYLTTSSVFFALLLFAEVMAGGLGKQTFDAFPGVFSRP